MIHDHATDNPAAGGLMHSAREGPDFEDILGKNSVKFSGSDEEGFLRCSNFLCFWNLDDVSPDDGGLLLVPGSHRANSSARTARSAASAAATTPTSPTRPCPWNPPCLLGRCTRPSVQATVC